jgi:hypothetical protein
VAWSAEDLFGLLEIPSLDGLLSLDLSPGESEFLPPFLKHSLALLDDLNGFVWWLLEDFSDVNLSLDLVTDLIGDTLQDILHLRLVLVDVPGNCPNELQSSQKGRKSFLNNL